ncbi:glycogen/starch/alpha-glucan phosphorylase [Faecalispora jeddahensis]|uniref:glycogen/starch/alpha-glucan phosphorylase n=1 Tax=Faecalispora jeddahensis TaxID=1414721 RepID=UPI00145B9100
MYWYDVANIAQKLIVSCRPQLQTACEKDFHGFRWNGRWRYCFCDAKLRANRDYCNAVQFSRKCLTNTAHAGQFSSDRTVREYAREIWGIPVSQ